MKRNEMKRTTLMNFVEHVHACIRMTMMESCVSRGYWGAETLTNILILAAKDARIHPQQYLETRS